jgi:ferric-dicitrate binding protein FerR (iron transport regulator)
MKEADETYGPIDFAQNEPFIDWVKRGADQKDPFWDQLIHDHPGKEAEILEGIQIVKTLQFETRVPDAQKVDQLWQKIDQETAIPVKAAKARKLGGTKITWYAAAAIGLFLIGFFFSRSSSNGIETAFAERIQHYLPDSSIVYLNADSKLQFREKNWTKSRTVYLTGEAFFDVKKGNSFEVFTDLGRVQVLGTSFNVRARESFQVACFTGKVEVTPKGSTPVKLLPGETVYVKTSSESVERAVFDPEEEKGWRFGEIDFPAASLKEVFNEIERQYDVQVEMPKQIRDRVYSGKITLQNLPKAIEDVCETMQLQHEKSEKSYRIFE